MMGVTFPSFNPDKVRNLEELYHMNLKNVPLHHSEFWQFRWVYFMMTHHQQQELLHQVPDISDTWPEECDPKEHPDSSNSAYVRLNN